MFGVGLSELLVIAFVAVVVFGPEKVPVLAKQAGAMLRKLRDFANDARDDLRTELGPEYADLELRDLDPRNIVRRHLAEAMSDDEDAGPSADAEDAPSVNGAERAEARPLAAGERPPYDVDAT